MAGMLVNFLFLLENNRFGAVVVFTLQYFAVRLLENAE